MTTPAPSLPALFDAAYPGDDALLLDGPDVSPLTYGEAEATVVELASALRALGVSRGDRVAVPLEKRPEVVLLYLACLRAGAVYVPMNPSYTDAEVDHICGDAAPKLAVIEPGRRPPRRTEVRTLDQILDLARMTGIGFDEPWPDPSEVAALLYTSGTTGRPKGAPLTHANIASNVVALREAWGCRPDDRLLHALPIYHTHGLLVGVNLVLATGSSMAWLARFDAATVLDLLPSCSVLMGVPTFYSRLLAEPGLDAERCAGMRLFVSGSAPLPATVHEAFEARTGHRVLERYGMTETMMLASNPLDGERRPGTVGMPLPGVEVRVAGGETGPVEVRGPNVFGGYWRSRNPLADFTEDGWFRTGDLGTFEDGGYLRLVGRSKDLVISGGLNVYPAEVEDVLDRIDGVAESAVIGVPHDDLGEAVVAVVVAEAGMSVDPDAVREAARATLAAFKVPKVVHVVDALPRNGMGKVEKTTLRQTYGPS